MRIMLQNCPEETMQETAMQRLADKRFNTWLWLAARKDGANLPIESFGSENLHEFLTGFLPWQRVNQLIEVVSQQSILPIEKLDWIKDDARQINWLLDYASRMLNVNFFPVPTSLFGKELLLAKIDFYENAYHYKVSAIEKMRSDWNEYLKTDGIFKWFKDGEEAARCAYAWDWLVQDKPHETYGQEAITGYEELLRFYDRIGVNAAQKELDVKKIRNNWNQKKKRENKKDKQQYNFELSHQVIADLDKLAKRYEVSRPKIIEALIKMEAAQNHYLPQKVQKTSLF
ncbi:hypothetical protein [Massilia sp. YIM B04103]|uniref:hypothetical protein n=1 Tax=Massilia sp. YIM B04103 TaxID=2963106 RepID=UPI00210930DE|nr:hypothetical protein [Massilia sp. YIM B04103]